MSGSATHHVVTEADTAAAVGSGDVPVLATPRLIAWMEAATIVAAAPFVGPGRTSVGTAVRVDHLRATPVGGSVDVVATPPDAVEGRTLAFEVRATDHTGALVARGTVERAVVDTERFLASVRAVAP